ncbi:MAG TPA: sugar ABC transporter permease [Dyella sp.]|uniref:carbohydrate ABC transporter permease n=1 Tax=Dyella sp. TaxID=1869338 RepID=UPI002F937A8B
MSSSRTRTAWLFVAPVVLLLLLVAAWPLGRSIYFSLTDANINDLSASHVIGLANYFGDAGLFGNRYYVDGFWASDWGVAISNTFRFAIVSVAIESVLGLGIALLLNMEFPGRAFVRTAILVPWAIPTIVSAKVWGWMLNDQFGAINALLAWLGITHAHIAWTAEPSLALWSVVAVDVWKTTPFMALLILAALQTLPKECYEAARVDGVHPLRVFFRITLPLIRQPLLVAVVFRILDALRVFDLIYVLTSNGASTVSMSGFVRSAMVENGDIGFGSAASTSLFFIILLSAWLFMKAAGVRLLEKS